MLHTMKPLQQRARLRRGWVATVTLVCLGGLGATWYDATDLRVDALRRDLDQILRSTGWRTAEWGILAVSLDSGDTLYSHVPDAPLVPASNAKLVTTAAALHYLGPDFRWETFVLVEGDPVDGIVLGDLVLYGTGDPGLSERFAETPAGVFEELAAQLVDAGIREVRGDVVGDGSFFEGPLLSPEWDPADLNETFAAPVGALSFNENIVTLRIEAGGIGGMPPIVYSTPDDPDLPIQNLATTGPGQLFLQRDHPREPIRIIGSTPRGAPDVWRRIPVRDPSRFAARALFDALRDAGISVSGDARSSDDPRTSRLTSGRVWAPAVRSRTPRVVARHRSRSLREYVALVNKESHNLTAEALLKTMGRVVEGEGSFDGGSRVLDHFLHDVLGVAPQTAVMVDGSGLAAANRLTPGVLVALLGHMAERDLWDPYWESLPEAGNRLELSRMYRTAAAGNLRAKTGTITGVSALSGVVRSATGERIAFSIIGNRVPSTWTAKRIEDRLGVRLAAFDRPLLMVPAEEGDPPDPRGSPAG
jgi:D-alanyl-D-alanine carboxypeptidase/D-alanyl-D-alanine-endopeptidase (penicillin-binding protein 4)